MLALQCTRIAVRAQPGEDFFERRGRDGWVPPVERNPISSPRTALPLARVRRHSDKRASACGWWLWPIGHALSDYAGYPASYPRFDCQLGWRQYCSDRGSMRDGT
jgi:hypothetical protein